MGFATEEQVEWFLKVAPDVERAVVDSGVTLLKYWLEVSPEETNTASRGAIHDGRKIWEAVSDGPQILWPLV